MKFKIQQQQFQLWISVASRAISGNNALPILSNLLIEAKEWKLLFTATDLDLTVKFCINAEIEEEWKITIPAKILQSYINLLKSWEISFVVKWNNITIKSANSNTKIKWIDSKDFPKTLKLESEEKIKIKSKDLKAGLAQTVFSTSISQSRPVLTGVLFKFSWNALELMSTDSYRFSSKKIDFQNDNNLDKSIIVPWKAMAELIRIIWENETMWKKEEFINIEISDNQILFQVWAIQLYSRLIEWTFPNCAMLIPKTSTTQAVVNKADLIQIIKRINIFAKENNNNIRFDFSEQNIKLSTLDTQIWSDESEIESAIKWDDIIVAMNSIFVLELLNTIKTQEVVIELNWQYSPVLFKNTGEDEFIHIIMPLRV